MSASEPQEMIRVKELLREAEQRFEHEMRARGFEPAQDEHLALTSTLARLYIEREELRAQLQSLIERQNPSAD